jgi:hypothetical protein
MVKRSSKSDKHTKPITEEALEEDRYRRQKKILSRLYELKRLEPLTQNQASVFEHWNRGKNLGLFGAAGTGKAQPLYSKVLTPSGWVNMGSLVLGDFVLCPDGSTAKILGIFPQGLQDTYEITFHDGRQVHASGEHLWEVFGNKRDVTKRTLMTTIEILKQKKHPRIRTKVPLVDFPINNTIENHLPIDPYLLGVLIGDGSITTTTPRITSSDPELFDHLNPMVSRLGLCFVKLKNDVITRSLRQINEKMDKKPNGCPFQLENPLTTQLKSLGIWGHRSYEKFIPEEYIRSSTYEKLELIRGLFDTDGTVDKSKAISFTTTSEILAKQVQIILWELGCIARISTRSPKFTHKGVKKTGRLAYTVRVRSKRPSLLFKLSRKQKILDVDGQYINNLGLTIKSIVPIAQQECQCILIDHPSHLYITDNFVVTHNTYLATYFALQALKQGKIDKIYIARSAVATRDIGFMPGTLVEKLSLYEAPYRAIFRELTGRGDIYDKLKEKDYYEFISTSYLRGLTLDNCCIILDEAQNCSFHEIDSVLTRLGDNASVILCGDTAQNDLKLLKKSESGLADITKIIDHMPEHFGLVLFQLEDIVRSGFVRQYLITKDSLKIL